MLNSIIQSSLNNRFFVIMATILVGGMGVYSASIWRSTQCPT